MKKGDRVRITPSKPDGSDHPHAHKTGVIVEWWITRPIASVKLDENGNIAIVSKVCLLLENDFDVANH